MTNQADRAINIAIKEVELVEVGKEKHDETLAKIEAKADKAELDSLKNTVSENQTQLQEQLQSQDEKINTKLDEVSVKALIAEAELDDLTLEQVQQEVIKQVADKASSEAVSQANEAQDAKINQALLDIQELKKEPEIVEVNYIDDILFVKESEKIAGDGVINRYLKIGNYYIPFFVKKLFAVKQDAFDLELVRGESYDIPISHFILNDGRMMSVAPTSDNDKVEATETSVTINADADITARLTSDHLDKPIVLNITAVDELNMQKLVDSLELTTGYSGRGLNLNQILPETVEVDAIKYVFDKEVTTGRNNSYQVFRNPEGESNALIMDGQNSIDGRHNNFVRFPYSVNEASLIKVEIIKNGQSYVKTFEPQEVKLSVGFAV